jgi:pyruvate/2-oxoglutarate dehydrogenase complex dihydrolipoamide acyltransferase (E2) component
MLQVRVGQELWATRLLPEGLIERWCAPDGGFVAFGEPVADIRIEGEVRNIAAPAAGILRHLLREGSVVEPDGVIAQLD